MKPVFVWSEPTGLGRHVHVLFRREVHIAKTARTTGKVARAKAELHCFADSTYVLRINGADLGIGPARFRPESPEHDTWDLAPHLKPGKNLIEIHAVAHGISTFMQPLNIGGFIAWGRIGGEDLATPGKWACRRERGYDDTAAAWSFTSSAIDLFDARVPAEPWKPVVRLERQDAWGPLRPRSIPHLTSDEATPRLLLGAYPLRGDEEVHSFRVGRPDARTQAECTVNRRCFARTWLHSPREQTVRAGLFWGEHYLNGEEAQRLPTAPGQVNRTDGDLRLRAGWNEFTVSYGMFDSAWEFHLALPRSAEVAVSATREIGSPAAFLTAGPFDDAEDARVRGLGLPPPVERIHGWIEQPRRPGFASPAYHLAWSAFGPPRSSGDRGSDELVSESPSGDAFCFDLGGQKLGRIVIEFEAEPGTTIDAGMSEHLEDGRPAILWRNQIFAGERHIAVGGAGRFATTKPRGGRYLQVNVTGGKARLTRVAVVEHLYPFAETGSFACSDPLFTELWRIGRDTLRHCAEDSYIDCPWRERHLYAGDLLPEMATTLAISDDLRLVHRSLGLLPPRVNEPCGLDDFPLIPSLIAAWYLERTGDTAGAAQWYEGHRDQALRCLAARDANGLFASTGSFVDWITLPKPGVLTAVNALAVGALAALARTATALKRTADAKKLRAGAKSLAASIRAACWVEIDGAFADAPGHDGRQPISSAWPVLFDVATAAQGKRIAAHLEKALAEPGAAVSPYGGFHVLGALYRLGRADLAERFLRVHWGRFVEAGADTFWEVFPTTGPDPKPPNGWSQCHAWSSAPTFYASTRILGVDLGFPHATDPGHLLIAPESDTVSWARGTVPHAAGTVRVDWRVDGDLLTVRVDAPAGVRWSVAPRGRLAKLRLRVI